MCQHHVNAVLEFLFSFPEGHDTTAAGVFWTLYILGRYPDALKKAQEEVDRVWGKNGHFALITLHSH